MTMTRSKSMSMPTAYSKPEPAFKYKSSSLSASAAPSSMPDGRLSWRVHLFSPAATVSRASASKFTRGRWWSAGKLRSTSMSPIKLGADHLVDMRTELTGGSGSVEAEDANVGVNANADGDRHRAFQNGCSKASLSVTTFIWPRITLQCVTIMPHR